jgi:hypothetical protein
MDRAAFFTSLRARSSGVFGSSLSQGQVDGINGILEAFEQVGNGERTTLAYALATAYHETGRKMVPVREGFATTDAGARRAVNNLARRRGPGSSVARYAQPQPPHGHVYYGRGHVQLTWLDNYRRSSADAGVDLVKNPDAMLDPVISARVLILGLIDGRWNGRGHGIEHYEDQDGLPGLSEVEAIAARRTVNVQDKAALIAGYYRAFDAALVAGGMPVASSATERPATTPRAPSASGGLLSAIIAFLSALFGGDSKKRGLVPVPHDGRTIWVTPDYHVEDGIRMPVDHPRAMEIARARGLKLPTKEMVDSIYAAADVKLIAQPIPWGRENTTLPVFRKHDEMVEAQLRQRGGLIAGHKKDILRDPTPGKVRIYGWHKADGSVWQNVSEAHGAAYKDYSHGLRLVYDPEK